MTINKYHIIFLAIYTVVVIWLTWTFAGGGRSTIVMPEEDRQQLDSLNQVISVLEYKQLQSDSLIKGYQLQVDELDYQLDSTKTKVSQIRKYYDAKIEDASRYTPTELDSFFTNRYGE